VSPREKSLRKKNSGLRKLLQSGKRKEQKQFHSILFIKKGQYIYILTVNRRNILHAKNCSMPKLRIIKNKIKQILVSKQKTIKKCV